MSKNIKKVSGQFCGVNMVAVLILALMFIPGRVGEVFAAPAKNGSQYREYNKLFKDVYGRIKKDYVEDVSDKDLMEAAINGMLTSLDPHSSYLALDDFKEMQVQTKGEFGGLGIEITMEHSLVKIVSPIDGTPAAKAGLKSGDYISHVNDESISGLNIYQAVQKLRGPVGSRVRVRILREGETAPLNIAITRDKIKIEAVKYRREGDVAYIKVSTFSQKASPGVKTAIMRLKRQIGKNMKGLVLDLRNNPGGLLDQAVAVSDIFLNEGEIVSIKGRRKADTQPFEAKQGDMLSGLPIIVLINEGSASASEIVAGALQDHKRGIVMGVKSFGKGSVQSVIQTNNGGAVRMTTARYYTPSGRSIQALGIEPDIIVKDAKIELIENGDIERSEAKLSGHLRREIEKARMDKNKKGGSKSADDSSLYDKDYQLARAIDLLLGISIFKNTN